MIFDYVVKETRWQPEPFTQLCCVAKWVRKHLRQKYPFVLYDRNEYDLSAFQTQVVDDCWFYLYQWMQQPANQRPSFFLNIPTARREGWSFINVMIACSLKKFQRPTKLLTDYDCDVLLPHDIRNILKENDSVPAQIYLIDGLDEFVDLFGQNLSQSCFIMTSLPSNTAFDVCCHMFGISEENIINTLAYKKI